MSPDERMDHLAGLADELVARVHAGDDPDGTDRWLRGAVLDGDMWRELCYTLAAAVPPTGWVAATGWVRDAADRIVDEVAVARACHGEQVALTAAERLAVIDRLTRQGASLKRTAAMAGVSTRTVQRRRHAVLDTPERVAARQQALRRGWRDDDTEGAA